MTLLTLIFTLSGLFTDIFNNLRDLILLSLFFIVIFALPAYYGLIKSNGLKKGLIGILALSFFALIFESIAIKTGVPYGYFNYTNLIGPKLFNTVPISIAFAWPPLVIGAFTILSKHRKNFLLTILFTSLLLVLIDMVIDPGAVSLNFWEWQNKEFLYHVPISNYIGWFISGIFGSSILFVVYKKLKDINNNFKFLLMSLYLIITYWTFVDLFKGLFISSIIGIALMLYIFKELTFDEY